MQIRQTGGHEVLNWTAIDVGEPGSGQGAPAPGGGKEPAKVSQVLFAGVGVPRCFAQLNSSEAVDRAAINRAAWAATRARVVSPHLLFVGSTRWRQALCPHAGTRAGR
jgi:hypothetical protein